MAESLEEIFIIEIDSIEPNDLDAKIGANSVVAVTIVDDDG